MLIRNFRPPPAATEEAEQRVTARPSELGEEYESFHPDGWSAQSGHGRRIRRAPTMDEQERPPEDDS